MATRPSTGDKETDEILDEMRAEGIEVPDIKPDDKGDTESDKGQETHSPDLDESEEESEEEEDEASSDDEASEDDDEEESEESDDSDEEDEDEEDEEDDEVDSEKDGKQKKLTLVQKYRKEKRLRQEAQEALVKIQQSRSEAEIDTEITKFAEANKMNPAVAKGLIDLAAKKAGLPKDMIDSIRQSQKDKERRAYWDDQRKKFDSDFTSNVVPVLESMGKKPEEISAIRTELDRDKKSPNWAWAKANKNASLVSLALKLAKPGQADRVSSETGGTRRTRTPSQKDPGDMTGDDINSMSDKEFDEFSDKLGKEAKTAIHRS